MKRSKFTVAMMALALVALAVPALSLAGRNTTSVEAKLKGKYVVDGGADKGGAQMEIALKPTQSKLCFDFSAKRLDPITYGAIHKAPEGEVGKEKVMLFSDSTGLAGTGSYEGCVKNVKSKLLEEDRREAGELLRGPRHEGLPGRRRSRPAEAGEGRRLRVARTGQPPAPGSARAASGISGQSLVAAALPFR